MHCGLNVIIGYHVRIAKTSRKCGKMGDKTIHEEIIDYIRRYPDGVSSSTLAETFLKFKTPDKHLAHIAVNAILQSDGRCLYENSLWRIVAADSKADNSGLNEEPWVAVYLLSGRGERAREIMHVSIWTLFDVPSLVRSQWLMDVNHIPESEREQLLHPKDCSLQGDLNSTVTSLLQLLENKTVVFFSSRDQGLWSRLSLRAGESMLDDTVVLSYLCKAAEIPVSRPMNLEKIYEQLFSRTPLMPSVLAQGEAYAECIWELIRRIMDKGIFGKADLESWDEQHLVAVNWQNKNFSYSDILKATCGPGVYGFSDSSGEYIYVGKAKNVRKRLMSYFRPSEESPEKLIQLRNEAYRLTVYECGSELESLLYEYRLIKKYAPRLNTQMEVGERKGQFHPIPDALFLLPHADSNKGMAVCFRKDQKVSLLPFLQDFSDESSFVQFVDRFFFSEKLNPEASDFPEQEIVTRWVNKNRDQIVRIDVSRVENATELVEKVKCFWPEVGANRA